MLGLATKEQLQELKEQYVLSNRVNRDALVDSLFELEKKLGTLQTHETQQVYQESLLNRLDIIEAHIDNTAERLDNILEVLAKLPQQTKRKVK